MARRNDHTAEELRELVIAHARAIVEDEGLARLTTRRIAGEIGYSPGTLYNRFADLDDIVLHLNATTLDALYAALSAVPLADDVETALNALADRYVAFVVAHPNLWRSMFRNVSGDRAVPDWYAARLDRLFALVEQRLAPAFGAGDAAARRRDAVQALWSGLHGMCSLAAEGILLTWDDVRRLSRELIETYVAGLRHAG